MPQLDAQILATASRTLIQSLGEATTSDDFCRLVVHNVLNEQQANSCFIAVLSNDSTIKAVGKYGYEFGAFEKSPLSVWEPSGISQAIRTSQVQRYDSKIEYSAAYDNNRFADLPGNGYLAIPFISSGNAIGGIGISFQLALNEINLPDELLDLIQLAARFFAQPMASSVRQVTSGSFKTLTTADQVQLTEREVMILGFMSRGYTNHEIGTAMHLSASSIRSASVALFRTLGVHSRKDAVAAARNLDLIDKFQSALGAAPQEEFSKTPPPPPQVRLVG